MGKKKIKLMRKYRHEYQVLHTMLVCAMRYLSERSSSVSERQAQSDLQTIEDFRDLYRKYNKRLDKKCRKKLGIGKEYIDEFYSQMNKKCQELRGISFDDISNEQLKE